MKFSKIKIGEFFSFSLLEYLKIDKDKAFALNRTVMDIRSIFNFSDNAKVEKLNFKIVDLDGFTIVKKDEIS